MGRPALNCLNGSGFGGGGVADVGNLRACMASVITPPRTNSTAGGSRGIIELGPTVVHVRGLHRLIRSACLRVTTRVRATALSRALWRGSACASMRPDTAPIPEQISSGLTPRIPRMIRQHFCHVVPHKMSVWFISCTVLQQNFFSRSCT